MKKYDSYKDSGIEWLKEIPIGWNLARMRYVCDISTGDKDTINKEENGNYPFYVRSKNIERISTYTYDEEAILTPGDGDICKIWHYINEYNPLDKAGSYGIQDWFGYTAVENINGCFYNVMGLPINKVYDALKDI